MKADEQIYTTLIRENKDKIYRICCYYISDEESRKDLFQEVLLNIWKGFKTYRGEASYLTWMLRITINTSLRFLSKERSLVKRGMEYAREIKPDDTLSDDEGMNQLNMLHKAINKLPLVDMIIISLVLEETDHYQIAKITGLKEGNIRVRIHRAKAQLKKIIEGGEL